MFVDKNLSESLINNEVDVSASAIQEGDDNMTVRNLIQIPKIDSEGDKMQPIEIYLDSCKLFAWQNLKYDIVKIDPLTFTQKHLQERVLVESISDAEIKRYNFLNRVSDVGARYENVDLWNFMEIIFVSYNSEDKEKDNSQKQHMLVKTWEQHQCLVPNITNMMMQLFYVKTIRIYDLQNKLIDTLFVEKIEGNFSGENIYDASLLHFKSKIYYFKRVWKSIENEDEYKTEGSPAKVNKSLKDRDSEVSSNYRTGFGGTDKSQAEQMSINMFTILVLHSYDIITHEEKICLNREDKPYQINELEANQGHVHEDGSKHYNLNVTFSKEFGAKLSTEDEYEDEIGFLDEQYVCCQAYIEKSQNAQFTLYSLSDLSKPFHHTEASKCTDPNQHDHTLMMTKQIQSLNHIRTADQNDKLVLVFILINTYSHIHFHYNPENGHIDVFKYDNQNIFNKTENSNITIQKINTQDDDQNQEKEHHDQYFFVDYNNQIQLLYPNFDQKSQRFLNTDIVSNVAKIPQQDARYFKKINRVHAKTQITENEACAKDNILQEIEHLRKILNFKSISKDQIFTFCSDHRDQLLYIAQAKKPQVIVIQVKDHHCEECYDNSLEDQSLAIKAKVSMKIQRTMSKNQYGKSNTQNLKKDPQHKSMGKQSRMKSLKNYLGQRIPEKIEQMCQQEENNDIITIDINTQEVIVTRNEFDKKDVSRNISKQNLQKGSMGSLEDIKIDDQDEIKQNMSNFARIDSGAEDGQEFKLLIQNLQHEEADFREQLNIEVTYHNERNYIFIISSVSFIDEIKRVSYFIVKKTIDQVEQLIQNAYSITSPDLSLSVDQGGPIYLLSPDDEISMIVGPQPETGLEMIKFKEIHDFKLGSKIPNQNLVFERFVDPSAVVNFMCFVYQEAFSIAKNFMITLDIDTGKIVRKVPINPNYDNQSYMYVNAQGFNTFKICRSGDIQYKEKVKEATWCKKAQILEVHETIFKVFTIYLEKLGRIQAQEFLITHDEESVEVQAIGQNQIMMSKECIQNSDWNHIQNSVVLPFQHLDQNERIRNLGCQFLLSRENGSPIKINMIDRVFNNLYTYESQVVLVGQKKFQVNRADQNDYIIIISARISTRIIEKKMFEQYETFSILRGAQEIMIEMRRPDLEYILLNTFQILKENDFFVSQEMLLGKSICDICLSDSRSVREALANYKQERSNINCSIVFQLVKGDELRKEAFKEIKFYPKNQVIKYDFNFDTTINMGLRMQSIKSVVMLLNFIMEEINTQEYVELIMLDLHEILEAKIINLNQFFGESANEFVSEQVGATEIGVCSEERAALGYCNIEIPLEHDDLAIFSQHNCQFETITKFENIHEIKDELILLINDRQKSQQTELEMDMAASREIEHTYIDLKFLIIGDKIKHLDDEESLKNLSYDDEYLAKLMMSSEENDSFYMQESVQKIIDCQFVQTKVGMTYLFWFYIFCYMIPYSITLINDNVLIHLYVMRICVIPQVVLLIIEFIQMWESGLSYFQGWNFIDLMQIMVFFNMFVVVQRNAMDQQNGVSKSAEEKEAESPWLPFIQIFLVILSFVKSLHFLTVFEELGFFVIMVLQSFIDLIPFVISYLFFQSFFATIFAVLKVEIDGEVASGVGLGYFLSLYLMVWRNSVGKLGLQSYKGLNNMPKSTLLYINIELIWLAYFVQIIFMLVIMLNFIIAIIDQTYVAVNKNKNMHVYMNKAELNEEYYQLAKYFKELKQFRVIVFSTSKEMYDEINESKEEEEKRDLMETFRRFIGRENEQNFQLQKANTLINQLLQRQQDIEFQMDAEFQRYSKYLKDFKKKTLAKISNPAHEDESLMNSESRSEVPGSNVPRSGANSGKYDQQVFSQGAYTFRDDQN